MRRFVLLIFLFITSCNPPAPPPTVAVTPEKLQLTETPPSPTLSSISISAREKYILNATVDYDRHFITIDQTIIYPNHTGATLNSLTLAIAANLWANCFKLNQITVDNIPNTEFALNAHRLDIPLQTQLVPDSVSIINLSYSLSLPYMDQANSLRARIFGYSDIQMNLVNWYPFVVPFKDGEWIIREPWSHGEYLVYPIADFEVNLTLANPENAPMIASSGFAEPDGEVTHYTLTEARTFAISASRDFQVSSTPVGETIVYSYYLPIYRNAGEAALLASAQALQVFSQRFGPYPHKTLSIVMADFKDSMEFSALYFHSRSFYDLYDGTPQNYLTLIAVHETGHQWWFEQVANDQAEEPWLDESLATYSEQIYYENQYPDLVSWWWSYRIDFFEPHGKINIPVYDGQDADTYKSIVYFNGAHFLQDLREGLGDEAFFAFLKDYFLQNHGRVATRADFFRILDDHTDADYSDIVARYFK